MSQFSVPDIPISKDLIERIHFSLSSRNAEAKVSECVTHVFGSRFVDDPRAIDWQYIASGVTCLLRNRELAKNGKKYVWSMSLCLYNAHYGVLVWKGKLVSNCSYTAVANNFHVFALSEVDAVIGLLFSDQQHSNELHRTYHEWHQERMRDEKGKGYVPPLGSRFKKEMISRPCNFQHIQGTQALDEILEIEKIKSDIHATIYGLGPRGRLDTVDSASPRQRRKKDIQKPRLEFAQVRVPYTVSSKLSASEPALDQIPATEQPYHNRGSFPFEGNTGAVPYTHPQDPLLHGNPLSPTIASLQSSLVASLSPEHGAQPPVESLPYETVPDFGPHPTPYVNGGEYSQQHVTYDYNDPAPPSAYQQQYVPPSANGFHSDNFQRSPDLQESEPGQYQANLDVQNYNPATGGSQGDYGYDLTPPRLDLNLEKEFTDSVLFQSTLMTSN